MADKAKPDPFETTGFNAFMRDNIYNTVTDTIARLTPANFAPLATAISALRSGTPRHRMTKLKVKLDEGSPKAIALAHVYAEAKKVHAALPPLQLTGSISHDTAAEISARIVEQAKAERRTEGPFHKLKNLTL